MRPAITKAVKAYEKSRDNLKRVLAAEQKACPHKQVIHSKWRAGEWVGPFKARRLCLDCGLEEEAKNSGWGDNDADFRRLKTRGFHKVVDRVWDHRFPEAEVNAP